MKLENTYEKTGTVEWAGQTSQLLPGQTSYRMIHTQQRKEAAAPVQITASSLDFTPLSLNGQQILRLKPSSSQQIEPITITEIDVKDKGE